MLVNTCKFSTNAFCPTGKKGGIDPTCSPKKPTKLSVTGKVNALSHTKTGLKVEKAIKSFLGDSATVKDMMKVIGVSDSAESIKFTVLNNSSKRASFYGLSLKVDFFDRELGIEAFREIGFDHAGQLCINNNSLHIDANKAGQGIGTTLFATQVNNAAKAGVKYIRTIAGRSGTMNGYYTWARLGYEGKTILTPNEIEKLNIPKEEVSGLGEVKLSTIMRTPEGAAFWKKNGETFEGSFSLSSRSPNFKRLRAYIKEKKASKKKPTTNAFCPGEKGGGRDNSCSRYKTRTLHNNAGQPYKVIENPSKKAEDALLEKSLAGQIRVLSKIDGDGPNRVVWDAMSSTHEDTAKALGLRPYDYHNGQRTRKPTNNAFCATGKLGGIDNSCSSSKGSSLSGKTWYVVHGGRSFDIPDESQLGSGEPGNIRPLGKGLYGFVVKDKKDLSQAIKSAKIYADHHGGEEAQIHVFKIQPQVGEVSYHGSQFDEDMLSTESKENSSLYHKANAAPVGSKERSDAFEAAWKHDKTLPDRNKLPFATEHLPEYGTEIAVRDLSRLERVGMWSAKTSISKIAGQVRTKIKKPTINIFCATGKNGGIDNTCGHSKTNRTTNSAAFKAWFKGSKVVDSEGNPKVIYHGTSDAIKEFNTQVGKEVGNYGNNAGIFFSDDPEVASGYADQAESLKFKQLRATYWKSVLRRDTYLEHLQKEIGEEIPKGRMQGSWLNDNLDKGTISRKQYDYIHSLLDAEYDADLNMIEESAASNVMSVYVSMKRPKIVNANGMGWESIIQQTLDTVDRSKHDGVIFRNIRDNGDDSHHKSTTYFVFHPNQIKSATGNRGTYSKKDKHINNIFCATGKHGGIDPSCSSVSGSKNEPGIFWHGSPSGDLNGSQQGIHVGTYEAAKQALEARIGVPATGEWDGAREYGKTLLAGKSTLAKPENKWKSTGYNVDAPEEDYYPKGDAAYSGGEKVSLQSKPTMLKVKVKGSMSNTIHSSISDSRANSSMKSNKKRGTARRGYYYTNIGEDAGSISAVVPSSDYLEIISNVFCATGKGGGIDPSCSSGSTSKGKGFGPPPNLRVIRKKTKEIENSIAWDKSTLDTLRNEAKHEDTKAQGVYEEYIKSHTNEEWMESQERDLVNQKQNEVWKRHYEMQDKIASQEKELASLVVEHIPNRKTIDMRNSFPGDEKLSYEDLVKKHGDEAVSKAFQKSMDEEHAWDARMRYDLSMGIITPEQAKLKDLYFTGGEDYQPLPDEMYHVTTAASAVAKEGLKTRDELKQQHGKGLGGGASNTISFTTDRKTAQAIMDTMLEAHNVATGKKTAQDMLDEAKQGVGANKDFLHGVFLSYSGVNKDPNILPLEIKDLLNGVKRKGWYEHSPTEPMTKEEIQYETFQLFKKFAFAREQAGGRMDPLFFLSDVEGFSKVDPSELKVVKAKPKKGTRGYQVSGLGEWRTHTGDTVDIVNISMVANVFCATGAGGGIDPSCSSNSSTGFIAKTPESIVKAEGFGGMREGFNIATSSGAHVTGYTHNADFPGEYSSPNRGELFFIEVPKASRGKGLATSLAIDAINLMKSKGAKTVSLHPMQPGAKELNQKLKRMGILKELLRTSPSGKEEWVINEFCATGKGGGIDPSCSPDTGGESGSIISTKAALKPYRYRQDNPKGSWLEGEQRQAKESAKSGKVTGSVTATTHNLPISIDDLINLPGQNKEHINIPGNETSNYKIDTLAKSMEDRGFDDDNGILVWVDVNGKASIAEGNHRIRAAKKAKLKTVPVQFRWFAGSENGSHKWSADSLASKLPTNNVFCATGAGGGVDPTCKHGGSTVVLDAPTKPGRSKAQMVKVINLWAEDVANRLGKDEMEVWGSLKSDPSDYEATLKELKQIYENADPHKWIPAFANSATKLEQWKDPDESDADFEARKDTHVLATALRNQLARGMSDSSLPLEKRKAYLKNMDGVLNNMLATGGSETIKKMFNGIDDVSWYKSIKELNTDLLRYDPSLKDLMDKGFEVGGAYNPNDARLFFDGAGAGLSSKGVYAHELGHAMDRDHENTPLSDSREWMEGAQMEVARLSNYATTSPAECFAEFSRYLWSEPTEANASDGPNLDRIKKAKKEFPIMTTLFQKYNLLKRP